ncbi:MAG: CRISPR-associated protein Cas3 [Acidobacteria bacterium]|nr:MAG: CRISPR-associated protein Cas3 [Acidobacteriota bacterium]
MSLPEPLPVLAKPSRRGITLAAHTRRVRNEAARVASARPFVCQKYQQRTGEDLAALLDQSALWHDQGKRHVRWQKPCQEDYRESVRTNKDCGSRIRRAGFRHELASLKFMREANRDLPLMVRAAVAAHHSKLSHRHQKRWIDKDEPTFEVFWSEFLRAASQFRIGVKTDFERAINERYKFAGVRALLQLADRRVSAAEEGEILPPLETFRYEFPHKDAAGNPSYRGVQKDVRKFWDEPFAVLRAPTGAGKTDAALLWAQHQVEQGRADRLVIAMPTRFTANALAITAAKNLSATGLYHSSALYTRTKDLYAPRQTHEEIGADAPLFECIHGDFTIGEIERFIDKEQELARKLETPVTVTTIDHLCIALTGTREDHHAIFFNLAHSCLVIDEADFYDDFTQQNIVMLLRALRALDVPVLLMSATVPESALEVYAESGLKAAKIHEDKANYEDTRLTLTRFSRLVLQPEDFSRLLRRALNGEPTIIYINTVRRAQELYHWFIKQIKEDDVAIERDEIVLYHSRFTEPHKVNKEVKLLRLLGREAWKNGEARGVAILTQIGEISVNISANLMISELCPVDRLAQRTGRLARFEHTDGTKSKGELFVVEPHRINKKTGLLELSPAPYGHYTNGTGWEMNEALKRSRELIVEGDYSAKRFVDLTNEVYPVPEKLASHVFDNREALRKCAILNWLILPQEEVRAENDDEHTKDWRSRDIPYQNTVYANFRTSGFDFDEVDELPTTYRGRRRFELRHGVKCHAYEFAYAVKNDLLVKKTIEIRERDPETVYLVPEKYYAEESGLLFTNDESEDFDD